jgi:hypothetical protein
MARLPEARPTGRIASLNALRGFDMSWIIGGDSGQRSESRKPSGMRAA